MATFSDIPVEDVVALHILPYLNLSELWEVRTVCKYFHRAVHFYIRYYLKKIRVYTSFTTDPHPCPGLATILSQSKKLQSLEIVVGIPDPYIYCALFIKSLESLRFSTPPLHTLKLDRVILSPSRYATSIHRLSTVMSTLRCLHLTDVRLRDIDLSILLKDTVTLEEFACSRTEITTTFINIIPKQHNLRILKLCDCLPQWFESKKLLEVVMHLSHLQTLNFEFIRCITDSMVLNICEYCSELQYLELQYCCNLSWNTMQYLRKRKITVISSSTSPQEKNSQEHI